MGESSYPLVSIITINFNNADVTCELLESLKGISYPNFEVVVVDNGSKEESNSILERHNWVTLLKTGQNLGYAGGNNYGIKRAKGKYFLLLNNDTEVDPGFLEPLVSKLESDPKAGAVSSKLIYFHSENIIQYAGSTPMNRFTGRNHFIGQKEKDKGQYNNCCETCYGHGAALMIPRHIIEEVGLMADLYFLYYEELDFCERIKKAGYNIWYVGQSVVYHKESMSVGKQSVLKTYYQTRNRLLFMRRNGKGFSLAFSIFFFTFVSMPKNLIQFLIAGKHDLMKAFIKGYIWNYYNFNIHHNPKIQDL